MWPFVFIWFGVFTGAVQSTLSSVSLSDWPPPPLPPPAASAPGSITTDGAGAMKRNEADGTNRWCRLMHVQSPGQLFAFQREQRPSGTIASGRLRRDGGDIDPGGKEAIEVSRSCSAERDSA